MVGKQDCYHYAMNRFQAAVSKSWVQFLTPTRLPTERRRPGNDVFMAASAQFQSMESSWKSISGRVGKWAARIPQETLRMGVLILLALWVLAGLVRLLWVVLDPAEPAIGPSNKPVMGMGGQAPTLSSSATSSLSIDPEVVKAWSLFGQFKGGDIDSTPEVKPLASSLSNEESNAAETKLQLTLNGMIESDTEKNSRAIITYQGKQDQYKVGEKLPVRGRVLVKRLLKDRVLLDNSGKVEALFLFDKKKAAASARSSQKPAPRKAASSRPASQSRAAIGQSMRQKLLNNPMSITDVVRISEARENGELVGYKVRPSKDRELFEKLGLKTNDIITSVNGVALDNVSNAMRVFQTLRTETEASFDISRDGASMSLVVSLDDAAAAEDEDI